MFDDDAAVSMEKEDIEQALKAARLDWAEIDPSIFATLFEHGLDLDLLLAHGVADAGLPADPLCFGPEVSFTSMDEARDSDALDSFSNQPG